MNIAPIHMVVSPSTQKAHGVRFLQQHGHIPKKYSPIKLLTHEKINEIEMPEYPCFARPCPVTPMHGFVESRVVNDDSELSKVWEETKEADPKGEVILMPFIRGERSAVMDLRGITIGKGHDGVTADRKGTERFEGDYILPYMWKQALYDYRNNRARLDVKENAKHFLLEAVQDESGLWVPVQIRSVAAPTNQVKRTPGVYIQKGSSLRSLLDRSPFHVNSVSGYSAKEFINYLNSKDPKRRYAVVYSLRSHYACLAIEQGFDVVEHNHYAITLSLGKPITGASSVVKTKPRGFYKQAANALQRGLSVQLNSRRAAVCASMASDMAKSYLLNAVGSRQWGLGIAMLFRLTAIACIGEVRYGIYGKPGMGKYGKPTYLSRDLPHLLLVNDSAGIRSKAYNQLWNVSLHRLAFLLSYSRWLFSLPGWGSNIGGSKWMDIAVAALDFYQGMRHFIKSPNKTRFQQLGKDANFLSTLVHNGGVGPLTKFTYKVYDGPESLSLLDPTPVKTMPNLPLIDWTKRYGKEEYTVPMARIESLVCKHGYYKGDVRWLEDIECRNMVSYLPSRKVLSAAIYITDQRLRPIFNTPEGLFLVHHRKEMTDAPLFQITTALSTTMNIRVIEWQSKDRVEIGLRGKGGSLLHAVALRAKQSFEHWEVFSSQQETALMYFHKAVPWYNPVEEEEDDDDDV